MAFHRSDSRGMGVFGNRAPIVQTTSISVIQKLTLTWEIHIDPLWPAKSYVDQTQLYFTPRFENTVRSE